MHLSKPVNTCESFLLLETIDLIMLYYKVHEQVQVIVNF